MPDTLTDDDYAVLSHLQHDRLRSHFPAELQDAALLTRHDATLVVVCDWETITLLNDDWDGFATVVYAITGCHCITFFVDGAQVLTQTRAIQLAQTVLVEDQAMVATAERKQSKRQAAIKQMEDAAVAVVATKETPTRTIADILGELTDLLAAQTIAKVAARSQVTPEVTASTPEQADPLSSPLSPHLPNSPPSDSEASTPPQPLTLSNRLSVI